MASRDLQHVGTGRGRQRRRNSNPSSQTRLAIQENERLQAENRRLILENERMQKSTRLSGLSKQYQNAQQTEARRKEIQLMIKRAQELDICFLLDATGSMKDEIDMVKERMSAMAAGIKSGHPNCELRVSLVVYRDYNMPITKENFGCDFTDDFIHPKSFFKSVLQSVRAEGVVGDWDYAEDVFSGLEWAAKLSWRAANRLLFHICDAPCHGTRFHDFPNETCYDQYPHGDKFGRNIAHLLKRLLNECKLTQYIFCHIDDSTTKMVEEFRKAIGKESWILEEHFLDIEKIPLTVIEVSHSTINKSVSAGFDGSKGSRFIPKHVENRKPNWDSIDVLNGQLYQHLWYSFDELLLKIRTNRPLNVRKDCALQVQIAKNPFSAVGRVRWPYHAQILQINVPTRAVVLKRFKDPLDLSSESVHPVERYVSQMEVQAVALHMANEFNERTEQKGLGGVGKVTFPVVSVLKVGSDTYNMEKYLEGNWIRYSNNAGYVNTAVDSFTLQAFTHWTHEQSGGMLMVTDLQGVLVTEGHTDDVEPSKTFWLSDPAVHSTDLMRFTWTNLGEEGFKLFFDSHICNDICRHLGLRSVSPGTFTESAFGSMIDSMKAFELKDDSGSEQPPLPTKKGKKVSVAPSFGAIVE